MRPDHLPFPLLRLSPNLKRVRVVECIDLALVLPSLDGTNRLELPFLESLTVVGDQAAHRPFLLVAPLLRNLLLLGVGSYFNFLSPPSLPTPTFPLLQEFSLSSDANASESNPLTHLRQVLPSSLKALSLINIPNLSDSTLRALTHPSFTPDGTSNQVLFPRLAELNLGRNHSFSGLDICLMVSSRKEEGRIALQELEVERDVLDEEKLRWLRLTVASVLV